MNIETERVPRPKEESSSLHERTYLSIQHLKSALFFRRENKRLESKHKPGEWLQVSDRHQALVIGTVLSTVAFLEATVNEMFTDASENFSSEHLKGLDTSVVSRLGELWKLKVPRTASFDILQKYNIALAATDHPAMDPGKNPTQNVKSLIRLRNALIHYEPETLLIDETPEIVRDPHRLESMLKGKFPLNQLTEKSGNHFFPTKCLGHGCADWAVESSISFVREFNNAMGTTPIFEHVFVDSPQRRVGSAITRFWAWLTLRTQSL